MQSGLNKFDFAYSGDSLISGDHCNYMFHEEFNAFIIMCHDGEGMMTGNQLRILQSPVRQCSIQSDIFLPVFNVNEVARFFVADQSGQYYCCDVFEPGFGYVFTDCGGVEVMVHRDMINSTASQQFRSQMA